MSLTVVSTPIGNEKDISLRAIETIQQCDALICEEFAVGKTLLKKLDVPNKPLYQLNEHTRSIDDLVALCQSQNVALISDCGTPSFSDPGYTLVAELRKLNIPIMTNPGASSLMALISLSSIPLNQFQFIGFLPASSDERQRALAQLKKIDQPIIIMDTPYRLEKTLKELGQNLPGRLALLGVNLTSSNEQIIEDTLENLAKVAFGKHPFIILIYPLNKSRKP